MNIIIVLIAFAFVVLWRLRDVIDNNTMVVCSIIIVCTICITTEIKQNKNNDKNRKQIEGWRTERW